MKDGNLQKGYNTYCMIFMTFSKLKKKCILKSRVIEINGAHFIFLRNPKMCLCINNA